METTMNCDDRRILAVRHVLRREQPAGNEVVVDVRHHHALHSDAIAVALSELHGHEALVHFVQRVDQQIELGVRVLGVGVDERLQLVGATLRGTGLLGGRFLGMDRPPCAHGEQHDDTGDAGCGSDHEGHLQSEPLERGLHIFTPSQPV